MIETQITGTLNGFDYEVTQTFVCGSMRTGEKSKYVNSLEVKDCGVVIFSDFWEGKESDAYLEWKAADYVAWFLENRDLFTSCNPDLCEHRIPASWSIHSREKVTSRNCLRVESFGIQDRCSLKMPEYWSEAEKKRAYIDIFNGFILDFGYCNGKCSGCV